MALVVGGIKIDPQGQSLVVNITIPSTGSAAVAYTATTDTTPWPRTASGSAASFPVTISTPTTFYVTAAADYLVSAKLNGNEVAAGFGQTATVHVDGQVVTLDPEITNFPDEARSGGGGGGVQTLAAADSTITVGGTAQARTVGVTPGTYVPAFIGPPSGGDDTAALNAAIASGSKRYLLAAGTYNVAGAGLSLPADVTVEGAGPGPTIINYTGSGDAISSLGTDNNGPPTTLYRVGLRNLKIVGTSAGKSGVHLKFVHDWQLERVSISGFTAAGSYGLWLDDSSYAGTVIGGRIENCDKTVSVGHNVNAVSFLGVRMLDALTTCLEIGPSGAGSTVGIGVFGCDIECGVVGSACNLVDIGLVQGLAIHGCYFEASATGQTGNIIRIGTLATGGNGIHIVGNFLGGTTGTQTAINASAGSSSGIVVEANRIVTFSVGVALGGGVSQSRVGVNTYVSVTTPVTDSSTQGMVTTATTQTVSGRTFQIIGTAAAAAFLFVQRDASGKTFSSYQVAGDTNDRLNVGSNASGPTLALGPGNAAADVRLSRSAAKTLLLDDTAAGAATLKLGNTDTHVGATVTTPAPTTGTKFTPSSTTDVMLYITCTTSTSLGVTMGPSTGAENTVVPTVVAPVGGHYSIRVPASWGVIVTGTIADFSFAAVAC